MVSQLADAPSTRAGLERLRRLAEHLRSRIKGQDDVLDRVAALLSRGELRLTDPKRPRGTFLFVGPTGVGKTETANVFTDYLFDVAPIRFDLSEYQLQGSVDKLIGADRGDSGLMGHALHSRREGTLLFDEIEKAHPLVLDLLLQILEDARITLATGETLNLNSFYVVCTSNIGSSESMRMECAPQASVQRTVLMRVREQLRPELVGRFQEIIVFSRLDYATQRKICEAMIRNECDRLGKLGYLLTPPPSLIEALVREGYHRTLGARPMRATVERVLQTMVAKEILSKDNEVSGGVRYP